MHALRGLIVDQWIGITQPPGTHLECPIITGLIIVPAASVELQADAVAQLRGVTAHRYLEVTGDVLDAVPKTEECTSTRSRSLRIALRSHNQLVAVQRNVGPIGHAPVALILIVLHHLKVKSVQTAGLDRLIVGRDCDLLVRTCQVAFAAPYQTTVEL